MAAPKLHVRRSAVHGRGIFAAEAIAAGTRVIEYKGQRISSYESLRRSPDNLLRGHTFHFALADGSHIDGAVHGNRARWLNHACAPNCLAMEADGRVFIHALTDIGAGEELTYDYQLLSSRRFSPAQARVHPCDCGAAHCRGTLLVRRRATRHRAYAPLAPLPLAPGAARVLVQLRGGLGQNLVQMVAGQVLAHALTQAQGVEHSCEILVPNLQRPVRNNPPVQRRHSAAGLFDPNDLPALFPGLRWRQSPPGRGRKTYVFAQHRCASLGAAGRRGAPSCRALCATAGHRSVHAQHLWHCAAAHGGGGASLGAARLGCDRRLLAGGGAAPPAGKSAGS